MVTWISLVKAKPPRSPWVSTTSYFTTMSQQPAQASASAMASSRASWKTPSSSVPV
jgi:hypothetical protein